jgi:uncharacterized damage-inducible protein DinB
MPDSPTELQLLGIYLDSYRGAAVFKLDGVDAVAARSAMVPSGTSLLGIVKHLIYVERWWFQDVIGGRTPSYPWTADDPDADWRIEADDTIDSIVAAYREECDASRAILAGFDDPETQILIRGEATSLRDVLVHMVEETARHLGHMDILRELVDGTTGLFPPNGAPWEMH